MVAVSDSDSVPVDQNTNISEFKVTSSNQLKHNGITKEVSRVETSYEHVSNSMEKDIAKDVNSTFEKLDHHLGEFTEDNNLQLACHSAVWLVNVGILEIWESFKQGLILLEVATVLYDSVHKSLVVGLDKEMRSLFTKSWRFKYKDNNEQEQKNSEMTFCDKLRNKDQTSLLFKKIKVNKKKNKQVYEQTHGGASLNRYLEDKHQKNQFITSISSWNNQVWELGGVLTKHGIENWFEKCYNEGIGDVLIQRSHCKIFIVLKIKRIIHEMILLASSIKTKEVVFTSDKVGNKRKQWEIDKKITPVVCKEEKGTLHKEGKVETGHGFKIDIINTCVKLHRFTHRVVATVFFRKLVFHPLSITQKLGKERRHGNKRKQTELVPVGNYDDLSFQVSNEFVRLDEVKGVNSFTKKKEFEQLSSVLVQKSIVWCQKCLADSSLVVDHMVLFGVQLVLAALYKGQMESEFATTGFDLMRTLSSSDRIVNFSMKMLVLSEPVSVLQGIDKNTDQSGVFFFRFLPSFTSVNDGCKGLFVQALVEKTEELGQSFAALKENSAYLSAYKLTTKEWEQFLAEDSQTEPVSNGSIAATKEHISTVLVVFLTVFAVDGPYRSVSPCVLCGSSTLHLADDLKHMSAKIVQLNKWAVDLKSVLKVAIRGIHLVFILIKDSETSEEETTTLIPRSSGGMFWLQYVNDNGSLPAECFFALMWELKTPKSRMFKYKEQMEEYKDTNSSTGYRAHFSSICHHHVKSNMNISSEEHITNHELVRRQSGINLLPSTLTKDQGQPHWKKKHTKDWRLHWKPTLTIELGDKLSLKGGSIDRTFKVYFRKHNKPNRHKAQLVENEDLGLCSKTWRFKFKHIIRRKVLNASWRFLFTAPFPHLRVANEMR